MICSLSGEIIGKGMGFVEIEVAGVGYRVAVGERISREWTEGQRVKVRTYMAVADKDISLYGFGSGEEVELFKMLLTVSGVGSKTAAQIVGQTESIDIMKAIGDADVNFFQKIKGIGKKTAQRIIVDLKSKIGGLGELHLGADLPLLEDDVVTSLKQLGFDRKEIERVMSKLPKEMEGLEERLSWCLRNLG